MKNKNIEISQEDIIKYNKGEIKQPELSKLYNTCIPILRKYLKEKNISSDTPRSKRKPKYNCEIFKTENELSSYFLGYFLADGNLSIKKTKFKTMPRIGFSCSINDKEFFESFIRTFGIKNKIIISKEYKIKNTDYISSKIMSVNFVAYDIYEILKKLNISERKTYKEINLPLFSDSNTSHFIRGYFDGDGSVTTHKPTGRKNNNYNWSILSYNKKILEDIQKFFYKFNIITHVIKDGKGNFLIQTSSKKQISKIYELIYKNSTFQMDRKMNKTKIIYNFFCDENKKEKQREEDVSKLKKLGKTQIEICKLLNISSATICKYKKNLFYKNGKD